MKILLVDDDPAVLQTLLAILKSNPSYATTIGTNGPLAIENAGSAGGVDLLITDVVMEPTDGFTLRQQLQAIYPAMRTIFISGFDLSDYAAHTHGCDVLTKPFEAEALLAAVAKAEPAKAPVAQPRAAAAPTAVAQQPTAVPMAQPVAMPVAQPVVQPTATPVARPTAVPTAQPTATPVAQPTATPVAQPTAVPVARPTAAPVAQPTATPVAQPTAVPVARPTAAPVAQPTATPVAQPTATPVARATAAPVAQPTATPVAQPTATPVARPTAAPVAQPTATPVAQPAATPVARATAVPTAQPTATPAVATPVTAVPVATGTPPASPGVQAAPAMPEVDEEIFGSDELLNKRVGNYNIVWKIGEDEWGPVYVAVQTSMARPVAMKVLAEEVQRKDPTARDRFIATARAKAAVKHPSILSVYEAGEASGHTYYTYEYVDGMHLAEARAEGRTIDDPLALRLIKIVAEGLSYLHHHKIPHASLEARRIYIGKDNNPHLANIATFEGEDQQEVQKDISSLSRIVSSLLPNGVATDAGLQAMLTRMLVEGNGGFLSWGALQQAAKALEPKVIPADAIKLTAQEEAAIRAVEESKRQQKRALIWTTVGMFCLLWVVAILVYVKFFRSNERNLNEMVRIPAGEFIYQDGKKATTGEYWIDKYEVTLGEYARFLEFLQVNPTDEFDHPDQPKGKSHIPAEKTTWEIYYGRARHGKPARYVPIDLNCPIFNVDYWDAYAYAKWAGKRLPTELEWEKAARGVNGNKFPWGNEYDAKKTNNGGDYVAKPGPSSEGKVDGYFWWNPVDAMKGDESPFGVVGMAGNMAEWTEGENKRPVARGGSFRREGVPLTHRVTEIEPEVYLENLGFRCASDTPPAK